MLSVYDLGEKPAPFLRFAEILPENDPLVSFKTQKYPSDTLPTTLTSHPNVSVQLRLTRST